MTHGEHSGHSEKHQSENHTDALQHVFCFGILFLAVPAVFAVVNRF